jgi:hypothetical protein
MGDRMLSPHAAGVQGRTLCGFRSAGGRCCMAASANTWATYSGSWPGRESEQRRRHLRVAEAFLTVLSSSHIIRATDPASAG